jgi:hypothetical protein
MRHSIGSKQNSILILFEELPGHARLAAQLSDAGCQLHMHVGKAIHALSHIREILCVVADVKRDELRLGMACQNAVARLQYFSVAWKILPVK